jgi:tetratricopeptide (TPR) repeat protein
MARYMCSSLVLFSLCLFSIYGLAQEVPPGHSHQGPAFDEGPREFAVLEKGTPKIEFETPNCSSEANAFIRQGIGQLHGFLNFESERSFRQAAYLDNQCAFAFWGMAMSSAVWVSDTERAIKFAKHAKERLNTDSPERERLYVESVEALAAGDTDTHLAILERIFTSNPNEVEAKAFFVVNSWIHKIYRPSLAESPQADIQSESLFGLAKEILAVRPDHPVHHYIIHMWDTDRNYEKALTSADQSGFAGPSIAHLWHMAGHIYSRAHLLFETWWSQEAAARTDHSYMQKSRIFPYWLHNHAHNNEWLSRTLMAMGNFQKAKAYALNMLAQPRHPKLNRIDQYQHVQNGVLRSSEVLERGEYWHEAKKLFDSPFMVCGDFLAHKDSFDSCQRMKALTLAMTGDSNESAWHGLPNSVAVEVRAISDIKNRKNIDAALANLRNLNNLQAGWGLSRLVRYHIMADRFQTAAKFADQLVTSDSTNNVTFILLAAAANAKANNLDQADQYLRDLLPLSQEIDNQSPFNTTMISILREVGLLPEGEWRHQFNDWRPIHKNRPQHTAMGPQLWQSIKAPDFEWTDSDGSRHSLSDTVGKKPAIVAFLLGNCPRCDDQFELLDSRREELNRLGVELIAIASTDANIEAFKKMWSYDQFEEIPIHGLFVLNSSRDVVWQDISATAFLDIDFLMSELPRALSPLQPEMIYGRLPQ